MHKTNNKTKTKQKNKLHLDRFLYYFVLTSFLIPIGFLILKIVLPTEDATQQLRTDADYLLMLIQCVLGVLVIHVPSFLAHRWNIKIPKVLFIMYILFLYGAIFLGEVRNFYYLVPHWDDILHCFSSMMTGSFGFMVITILNDDKKVAMNMSPKFAALFSFTFSIAIGAVWELYEYAFDGLLGLNMQKFMLENGTILSGHAAISDTMADILVDSIGAFIASVVGYFSMKSNRGWIYDYITKQHNKTDMHEESASNASSATLDEPCKENSEKHEQSNTTLTL